VRDNSIFNPINEYLANSTSRPTFSYHPSSASCVLDKKVVGECLRKQYWKWKREPHEGDMSYRSYIAVELGRAYEQAFLKAYRARGLLKASNLRFKAYLMGLNISGEVDGLTKAGEVIECKTAYGKAFFNQVNKKPKEEHLCQIMVYLACLGLDTCILPYGSRDDTGKFAGYRLRKRDIEAEGILFIKIIDRWKQLKMCVETNLLPERDFVAGDWQCNYCSFKKKCYLPPKELEINTPLL